MKTADSIRRKCIYISNRIGKASTVSSHGMRPKDLPIEVFFKSSIKSKPIAIRAEHRKSFRHSPLDIRSATEQVDWSFEGVRG